MNVAETLVAVPQAKELEPLLGELVAAGYQPRKLTLGRMMRITTIYQVVRAKVPSD